MLQLRICKKLHENLKFLRKPSFFWSLIMGGCCSTNIDAKPRDEYTDIAPRQTRSNRTSISNTNGFNNNYNARSM